MDVEMGEPDGVVVKASSFACGRGVFAKRSFSAGAIVFEEPPFMISPAPVDYLEIEELARIQEFLSDELDVCPWADALLSSEPRHVRDMSAAEARSLQKFLLRDALLHMAPEERVQASVQLASFRPAHGEVAPPGDKLDALALRFRHNSLPLSGLSAGFVDVRGMFATGCRIQHACRPNLRFAVDLHRAVGVFSAIRPIVADEELTLNYLSLFAPPSDPAACTELKERMGFQCSCGACVA